MTTLTKRTRVAILEINIIQREAPETLFAFCCFNFTIYLKQ